jgi:hypothetical protein
MALNISHPTQNKKKVMMITRLAVGWKTALWKVNLIKRENFRIMY